MFLGVVPERCITQVLRTIDFTQWQDIYVCCSGTFRFERAILSTAPQARLYSNDVSVFTVPIGRYLTDDDIAKFDDIKIDGLSAGSLGYEQVSLIFLPEDLEIFENALKAIEGKKTRFRAHAARIDEFDRFFEAVVKTKQNLNVHNSAMAITVMAELALERLGEMEASNGKDKSTEKDRDEKAKGGKRKGAKPGGNGRSKSGANGPERQAGLSR